MTGPAIDELPYRPCVGLMLLNERGEIFAARRIDTPGPAWQMPQGGIDVGEEPRRAALRELEEETGLPPEAVELVAEMDEWLCYDLPRELVPKIWGGRFRGQKQRWFLLRLTASEAKIDIDRHDAEFSDWCWLPAEELLARIVPFKRDTYARVIAAFAPHLRAGQRG